jgi:hypothetical protein
LTAANSDSDILSHQQFLQCGARHFVQGRFDPLLQALTFSSE